MIFIFSILINKVTEAKLKVSTDLGAFRRVEFSLEHRELAEFLQRPEVRNRILKFISAYVSDQEKKLEAEKENTRVLYCSFQVKCLKDNKENCVSSKNEYTVAVFTNIVGAEHVLFKHLSDVITVNYKMEVPEHSSLINSIRNQDTEWTDIYMKYSKSLDFCLESYKEKMNILKEIKLNQKIKPKRWFVKLTGFKEELDQFKLDLEKNFI